MKLKDLVDVNSPFYYKKWGCGDLTDMFCMQYELQARLGYDFDKMSDEEKVAFIKEMSIHLIQEINEALYELPYFKPWKDYSKMTKVEKQAAFYKYAKEMVDAWHFFMNMLIAADISPYDFVQKYKYKNKENHVRQDRGYTHDVSYREDK